MAPASSSRHAIADEFEYLNHLAPDATVAVFEVDAERGVLVARHVRGAAAARLEQLTIDIGYQVSGWVAANWVPMVNVDAQLDLDFEAQDLRYALSLPLLNERQLAGVITLYSAAPFDDGALHRAEEVLPRLAETMSDVEHAVTQTFSRDLRLVSPR